MLQVKPRNFNQLTEESEHSRLLYLGGFQHLRDAPDLGGGQRKHRQTNRKAPRRRHSAGSAPLPCEVTLDDVPLSVYSPQMSAELIRGVR